MDKRNTALTNGSSTLSELFPSERFHEFLVKILKHFASWSVHMYFLHHPKNLHHRFYQSDKLNEAQPWTVHPKYSNLDCSIFEDSEKKCFCLHRALVNIHIKKKQIQQEHTILGATSMNCSIKNSLMTNFDPWLIVIIGAGCSRPFFGNVK